MEVNMDIYLILRIALVGIIVSILNQILNQAKKDELAFLVTLGGWLLVLLWLLPYISDLFTTIQDLFNLVQ
jgi:stage III sporulation protein AC